MEIKFEPSNENILNELINTMPAPRVVIVDSHSRGYFKRRKLTDKLEEAEPLNSTIDGADYYDKLEKES